MLCACVVDIWPIEIPIIIITVTTTSLLQYKPTHNPPPTISLQLQLQNTFHTNKYDEVLPYILIFVYLCTK